MNTVGSRVAVCALALGLTAAACGGDGGTEVSATGDPASSIEDVTTTTPEPPTTVASPPTVPTTVTVPPTTTPTVPTVAPCPERAGEPKQFAVGLRQLPEGIAAGDEFACGRVDRVRSGPPWSIDVDVWDDADFLQRTEADPNVRYVEEMWTGTGGAS